jgi:hypothetical protein
VGPALSADRREVAIEAKGATYTDLNVGLRVDGGWLVYEDVGALVAGADTPASPAGVARLETLISIKGWQR